MKAATSPSLVAGGLAPGWSRALPALGIVVAALLAIHRDTAAAMVAIWSRSDTFAHAWLVPPIALWLAWRLRARLLATDPRPAPWALLAMAFASLVWFAGQLAAVGTASQFALVALIVLAVPALLGNASARVLAFPLGFLFFAVPFGEFLVPTMVQWTATITVEAVRLTGVPVYREGNQFFLPSGHWSVIEACSGVRYLIASVMVGTLFAYLNYRSLGRRLAFVGAAIAVPIVANWLRAYMIVMLGHLSNNRIAVGVDHLVYGWVLFGVVIVGLYMVGARWAQPAADTPAPVASTAAWPLRSGLAVGAVALLLAAWPLALLQKFDLPPAQGPVRLEWPAQLPGGWVRRDDQPLPWQAGYDNASAAAGAVYAHEGRVVGVQVLYFRQQDETRKMVSSTQSVVNPDDHRWIAVNLPAARIGELDVPVLTLRPGGLSGSTRTPLQIWKLYWVDGAFMTHDAQAKLRLAWARTLGRGDDSAVLLLYANEPGGPALQAFAGEALGGLGAMLEHAKQAGAAR